MNIKYYYYRCIVRFPKWLDFLFITFCLHFFLSWMSIIGYFPHHMSIPSQSTTSNDSDRLNFNQLSQFFTSCCCLPSETYGKNGVTPIFRSFHKTASSTTGGWSRWNIFNVFFNKVSIFCVHFHFLASTLCMCFMYLTSI